MDATAERNTPRYWINRMATGSVVVVLAIMLSSAYLRQSSVRAGCPDWPACTQRAPAAADGTPVERSVNVARLVHRSSASIAGAAVLLVALLSWVQRPRNRTDIVMAAALLAVTSFLAALGRWSGAAASPSVTLGNLLGGMMLIALLHWLRLRTAPAPAAAGNGRFAALPGAALALTFAAIALGALLGGGSSAASTGRGNPIGLAHGLCGLLVLLLAAVLAMRRATPPSARAASVAAFALACALALAGWISAQFGYPLPAALVHNLLAALLLLSLVTVTYRCVRPLR
jgi:cytochrome c oxidase assembly protein subunit 15